jgi:hypothetical protein
LLDHCHYHNQESRKTKKALEYTQFVYLTMSSSLPIVVCALDAEIGKPVSELLLPEFEG